MQLETLLLEAKAAYKRPPHSIPERLETQDVHSAWRALRGEAPLEEWFPPSLREGWEWIPNVFPDRDTENLLLILHGMGDSPGGDTPPPPGRAPPKPSPPFLTNLERICC